MANAAGSSKNATFDYLIKLLLIGDSGEKKKNQFKQLLTMFGINTFIRNFFECSDSFFLFFNAFAFLLSDQNQLSVKQNKRTFRSSQTRT